MGMILLIVGLSVLAGSLLILLTAAIRKKNEGMPPQKDGEIDASRFERLCCNLLYHFKLEIDSMEWQGAKRLGIVARNPAPVTGGIILVECAFTRPHEIITAAEIIEFSNLIVQDRACKGIFITLGTLTPQVGQISECAPMELIDGKRLRELTDQCHL